MNIFDKFRDVAVKLGDIFFVPATISRPVVGVNGFDPIRSHVISTPTPIACRGALGQRTLVADNGSIVTQRTATLDTKPQAGDTLTLGTFTGKVSTVEEIAPDGQTPMMWRAVLS
jgi:hypothetical protein